MPKFTYILVFLGKIDEKATQLHAIASLKVLLDATKAQNGAASSDHLPQSGVHMIAPTTSIRTDTHISGRSSQETEITHLESITSTDEVRNGTTGSPDSGLPPNHHGEISQNQMQPNNVSYGVKPSTRSAETQTPIQEKTTDNIAVDFGSRARAKELNNPEAGENYIVAVVPPDNSTGVSRGTEFKLALAVRVLHSMSLLFAGIA